MMLDYSEVVSKLLILMGAGMSLKQSWNTISARYSDKRKKKEVPKPTTQKKDETAKAGEKAEGSKGTTGDNNQGANKAE